jgi:hypothetical protein
MEIMQIENVLEEWELSPAAAEKEARHEEEGKSVETAQELVKEAKIEKEEIRPNRAWRRVALKALHLPARPPLLAICMICRLPFLGTAQARCQCKAGTSKVGYIRIS